MIRFFSLLLFCLPLVGLAQLKLKPHHNQSRWSLEYHFGGALNMKLPLTIVQDGYPDIYIAKADFASESFTGPHYWNWKAAKWFGKHGITIEGLHHKIYLRNKPDEVQRFGISHGYNMCILSYNRNFNWFNTAIGGGSILMHPESTIRGMVYPEGPGLDIHGYVLRGLLFNAAISRQIRVYKRFYLHFEGKFTASRAKAPIINGYAQVNNVAFHVLFGGGFDFGYSKKKVAELY